MSDNMYEVLALVPPSSDFTLSNAVSYFRSLRFRGQSLRSELARAEGDSLDTGFRIWYGNWSIVAWLDEAPGVLADSESLVDEVPLPASPDQIAKCAKRLCVWSDEDPDGDHSDEITAFTDNLRGRFGVFIYDPVNGGWWT